MRYIISCSFAFKNSHRIHSLLRSGCILFGYLVGRILPFTGAVYVVFFSVVIFIALLFWWMLSGGPQYVMTPIWINVVFCHCTIVDASLLSLSVACRIVFKFVYSVSHSTTTDILWIIYIWGMNRRFSVFIFPFFNAFENHLRSCFKRLVYSLDVIFFSVLERSALPER